VKIHSVLHKRKTRVLDLARIAGSHRAVEECFQ
jgi:hypothetical protein